jgi:CDP-4-dehydro-6-deoxyglucose reductase
MPFTIRVAHQNKNFIVDDNETILDAALRQNLDIPHSCCEGICGSCEAQIIEGMVRYDHTEHLALDEEDRAQGKALLCSAFPQSDLLIDIPADIASNQSTQLHCQKYQLLELKRISTDVYQALLRPESTAINYLAGQYLEAHIPLEEVKLFSIANAPNPEQIIELHIRCQKDNTYAKTLITWLEQKKTLDCRGPYGSCFYHPNPKMPALMLAVGTGFAPIKAILEQAFTHALPNEITLFWAGKSLDDLYQLSLVEQWANTIENFRFIPILTDTAPPSNWQGTCGNILEIVLNHYPDLKHHHIYFGGPMQLTLDALEQLTEHGAETCFMYSDVFDLL